MSAIPWFGVTTFIWFGCFGVFWSSLLNEKYHTSHFDITHSVVVISKIDYVEEKDKYWDCYSQVLEEKDSIGWRKVNGKLLIRIPKAVHFIPNARDIIQGKYFIRKPDTESAPYEFNWSNLLHHRNIHNITYADTNRLSVLYKSPHTHLEKSREWSDDVVKQIFGEGRDYPVATAMLLGLRRKIDPELYRAYSSTGAVHVLAVSGLHVGILAQIIEFFLSFFVRKLKIPKYVIPPVVIIFIWLYTFLTGATPSILRSAIMFTLFILGRLAQKDAKPMNILAGAAFVILIRNPLDIFNIGFQLSFGAMAGIFILYEPIRTLINTSNKIIQTLWKILAVSFAAQLIIYPIVGYHFHQFAFYFWLTSLISSPLSFLILGFGLLVFPVHLISSTLLGFVKLPLIYSIKWMNDIIAWIYTMPLGKLGGWWPGILDCILLILLSVLLGVFLQKRNYYSLKYVLITCISFFLLVSVENYISKSKSELLVSAWRGKTKAWVKDKNSLIYMLGDTTGPSGYKDKYQLKREHTFLLAANDSAQCGSDVSISKYLYHSGNTRIQIINSKYTGIASPIPGSIVIANPNWIPDSTSFIKSNLYSFDAKQSEELKQYFPLSKIKFIDKSYIQLPLQ